VLSPQWRALAPSASEALAAAVRNAALEGTAPTGSQLPAERVLASQLGISRGTADALRDDDAWSFTPPPGGLWLWLRLARVTGDALAAQATSDGLAVLPGSALSPDGAPGNYVRVPFTAPPATLTQAAALLKTAHAKLA
jgi:DNA-binding transcriptional MocR family regulator